LQGNGTVLYYVWMDFEEIRDRIRGPGFRPFRLHLSDGRAFDVPHPEFIAASTRVVAVLSETGPSELIDLAHIVSLEEVDGQ